MSDEEEDVPEQQEDDNAVYDFEPDPFDDEEKNDKFIPEHLKNENFDNNDANDEEYLKEFEQNLLIKSQELAAKRANDKAPDTIYEAQLFGIEYVNENLGEDFEDTIWLPPTIGNYICLLFCYYNLF